MRRLTRADFGLIKVTVWALAFWIVAEFTVKLESIARFSGSLTTEQILFKGSPAVLEYSGRTSGLFSLAPLSLLVDAFAALAIFSALMFGREILNFTKYLKSLAYLNDVKPSGSFTEGVSV